VIFVKTFSHYIDKEYPDEGCSLEICLCENNVEMEVLSPLEEINPGEEIIFQHCWDIGETDKEIKDDFEAINFVLNFLKERRENGK